MAIRQFYCSTTGEYPNFVAFAAACINEVYGAGHATYNTTSKTVTITNCFGRTSETITTQYGSETQFSRYPISIGIDAEKNFMIFIAANYHTTMHAITDRIQFILYDEGTNHMKLDYSNYTGLPFNVPTNGTFQYSNVSIKVANAPEPAKVYLTRLIIGNAAIAVECQTSSYALPIGARLRSTDNHVYVALGEDIFYKES